MRKRPPWRLGAVSLFGLFAGLLATCSTTLASSVERHHFDSTTLGNPYPYTVYLPDGYADDSDTVYPVVYLLHGSFGNERDWVAKGNLKQTADRLIRAGHIPPSVFIMPGSRSWWVDGYNEAARSAFFNDLMPHVEERYRVGDERAMRGVAGLSAGGFGALNFALERPDMFAAVGALSPASYAPFPPANSSANRHPAFLNEQGEFDRQLWEQLNYTAHLEDYRIQVTPRPAAEESDVLPVPLYISAGRSDVFDAELHARQLRLAMEQIQPNDVHLDLYPGGHTWQVWRASLPAALNFMFQHIGQPAQSESGE
ncbi:alpha/beta hydrolase [Halomonas sp. HL-93]|uniref:alpha/beta hydrolase n=1 Tax=Halomonas sp. HL-93 TaxID=1666906 RepID=UPI0006DBC0AF|nr:alpha/beta hydrolase-fold protein [Halomonas sp. HL-93]KPQ22117.1 MAG: esterase [Halomonas sp. HL-93]SBR52084.1 Enterochelin esterase [Halomonas sp. HL-93]